MKFTKYIQLFSVDTTIFFQNVAYYYRTTVYRNGQVPNNFNRLCSRKKNTNFNFSRRMKCESKKVVFHTGQCVKNVTKGNKTDQLSNSEGALLWRKLKDLLIKVDKSTSQLRSFK